LIQTENTAQILTPTVISGYCRKGHEICAPPGYDAAYSGIWLSTFREKKSNISWPLKIMPIFYPETSLRNCHYTQR